MRAEAQAAQNRGVRMWVETVIPYLVVDRSYAEKSEFEGAKYVMSPPLREKRHQEALWTALATGQVNTVATDHAPFDFHGQKEMGRGDFTKIPNGIPSVEDRVNLLHTYGVQKGRIDLHRFVDAASTQAAQDLRIVSPQRHHSTRQRCRPGDLRPRISRHDFRENATDERRLSRLRRLALGRPPRAVTVRGKIQVRDGKFIGEQARGQMLKARTVALIGWQSNCSSAAPKLSPRGFVMCCRPSRHDFILPKTSLLS